MPAFRTVAPKLIFVAVILAVIYAGMQFLLPPKIAAIRPERGLAVEAVYATGVVEPVLSAQISPISRAPITEIRAFEGQKVQKGDVLAQLENRASSANLDELRARVSFLQAEYNRANALVKRGIASKQSLDRARSELQQAQANLKIAQQQLVDLQLIAPIDGVILRRDGEVGEMAEANEVLFTIGQEKPLRVTADVEEEDIPKVEIGQKALIKADAFPGQVLNGKINEITPMGDAIAKTYRIRLILPDESPLLVGMTAEVNIIIGENPNALLVPASAVRGGEVMVIKDGKLTPQRVVIGSSGNGKTEIVSGLEEGAVIAENPPKDLKPGARVRANVRN